jgi:hypothetical protein
MEEYKMNVQRTEVWAATIDDRPGGLHEKLAVLAEAGANLEFVISRRTPDQPGEGVVFVTPIKGARQTNAAEQSGFRKTDRLHSVRVEGMDKPGIGAAMTEALADSGLNLRGISGAAMGRQFIAYLALDTAEDAATAIDVLKKLSAGGSRGNAKRRGRKSVGAQRLRALNNPRHRQRSTARANRRRTRTV